MSFSTLVSDLAYRNNNRGDTAGSQVSVAHSTAKSYTSTAAPSVSISGDISSQLHGGYSHPLARAWQAERQLTKVLPTSILFFNPAS
jgi:porphobilinogen synthase